MASAAWPGRAVESAQADDRRLIALVRARNLLYARNTLPVASYYAQVRRLWQEVADHMGWTVAEVRRKWSHIRNSYSRHLRNQVLGARTGRGRAVSRWYLADELSFLRDHMATDTRTSYKSPTLVEMESLLEPHDALVPSPWLSLGAQHDVEVKTEPSARGDSASPQTFDPDENCSFFQFFRGIYNDYQELPARKQRLFKRKCLHVLHGLLDQEDAEGVQPGGAIDLSSSALSDDERASLGLGAAAGTPGDASP